MRGNGKPALRWWKTTIDKVYKSVLDALRENRKTFRFLGEELALDPTVGVFITMNPGYRGRTELPESLKALFRPVTVVAPDIQLICENMLMAGGFTEARVLSRKFLLHSIYCFERRAGEKHSSMASLIAGGFVVHS